MKTFLYLLIFILIGLLNDKGYSQNLYSSSWSNKQDIVYDNQINLIDFSLLARYWQCNFSDEYFDSPDINIDGIVDINDLNSFIYCWSGGNNNEQLSGTEFLITSKAKLTKELIFGASDLRQACDNDNYVFATSSEGNVYRKAKSPNSNWELTAIGEAEIIWTLWGDNLLGVKNYTTIKYSPDNGSTWYDSAIQPILTKGATFNMGWSVGVRKPGQGSEDNCHYGTIILVEYGLGRTAEQRCRKIFRSIDCGISWSRQYQIDVANEVPDLGSNSHFHTVAYNQSLNRFLAIVGDGANEQMRFSDDDGVTWNVAQRNSGIQPVQLVDMGDSRFLCGSDKCIGVYTLDISDMENVIKHHTLQNWNDITGGQRYCFMLKQMGGLYYAFQFDYTTAQHLAKISVSPDGIKWSVYYQFDNNEQGVRFVSGMTPDGIHVSVMNADGLLEGYILEPAKVEIVQAIAVQSEPDNVFASISYGDKPDDMSYWVQSLADSAVITSEADGGLFSDRHISLGKGSSGYLSAQIPFYRFKVPADGRSYIGRIWLRAISSDCTASIKAGSARSGYTPGGYCTLINKDDWIEVLTEPLQIPAQGVDETVVLRFFAGSSAYPVAGDVNIHLGAISLSSNRAGYLYPGNIAYESLTNYSAPTTDSWKSVFTIISNTRAGNMHYYSNWNSNVIYASGVYVVYSDATYISLSNGNIGNNPIFVSDKWLQVKNYRWHIRSWMKDINNYLCLYLDSVDLKIKLDIVVNGNCIETLETDQLINFEWLSQLDFEIIFNIDKKQIEMKVCYAGHNWQCVSNLSGDELLSSVKIFQVMGNHHWLKNASIDKSGRVYMSAMPLFIVE